MSEEGIQRCGEWVKAIVPRPVKQPDGRVTPDINVIPMWAGNKKIMVPSDLWHMPCPLERGDVLHDSARYPTWRSVYGVEAMMRRGAGAASEVCHMFQYLPTKEWGAVLPLRDLPRFFLRMGNEKEWGNTIDEFIKANLQFTGAGSGKRSSAEKKGLGKLLDKVMAHSASRHAGGFSGSYNLESHIVRSIEEVGVWFMREFSEEWRAAKTKKGLTHGDGNLRAYTTVADPSLARQRGAPVVPNRLVRRLTGGLQRAD